MLLLIQSVEGYNNSEMIVNTEINKLEKINVARETDKGKTIYLVKATFSECRGVEVHENEEDAKNAITKILSAYNFNLVNISEIVSKLRFDFQ